MRAELEFKKLNIDGVVGVAVGGGKEGGAEALESLAYGSQPEKKFGIRKYIKTLSITERRIWPRTL